MSMFDSIFGKVLGTLSAPTAPGAPADPAKPQIATPPFVPGKTPVSSAQPATPNLAAYSNQNAVLNQIAQGGGAQPRGTLDSALQLLFGAQPVQRPPQEQAPWSGITDKEAARPPVTPDYGEED